MGGRETAVPRREEPGSAVARPQATVPRLPNSVVARLARTPTGRTTLARWHTVRAGAYQPASPGGSLGRPFVWQEEEITTRPRPGGAPGSGFGYAEHAPATPDLKVSRDNTIAVQNAAGEVKEAYLDATVLQNANQALTALGSQIELGQAGHTVTVPPHGAAAQNTLEKVRPIKRAGLPGANAINADEFPAVVVALCRDAASQILGLTGSNYLNNIRLTDSTGATSDVVASASGGLIVKGSQELAEAVANRQLSLANAVAVVTAGQTNAQVPQPGKAYGRGARKGQLGTPTSDLGINEDAWAHLGQSYVIQSVFAKEGRNYSDRREPKDKTGFGYHFAAVVAESLDSNDAVTLENYRRTGEIAGAANLLLDKLEHDFKRDLKAALSVASQMEGKKIKLREQEQVGAILAYIESHTAPDFQQASDKWKQIAAELGKAPSLYFFRMVSRESADQSFHGQAAKTGYFSSPITFVMIR